MLICSAIEGKENCSKMSPPNDWDIRKCLMFCSALFLAALICIELGNLGLNLLGLRQLIGFLFLALVPGVLILRILRIHNISIIESLLYSVGLSIAFIIAIGIILNFILPPLGVARPIAIFPLIAAVTIAILILSIVAYIRDKSFTPIKHPSSKGEGKSKMSFSSRLTPFLLAVLLPLLTILGVSIANSYHNNALLLVLIFIVAVIIGLVAFDRFIPREVYPVMIVMIALSLFYQTTLFSNYLIGSDVHLEYYYARLVYQSGFWDSSIAMTINSCLSIVMLSPVYSLLLGMDIVWLFKIVYPIFFCLAPLAIYRIFRLQMGSRYAFLAACFFISQPMFFMDMPQLLRQQVSELFFVLVILLMVDRKLTLVQRTILVIIFGFGVIVSYYGLGTGYAIGYITFGMLVLFLLKSRPGRIVWQWLIGKSNSLPDDLYSAGAFNKKAMITIVSLSLVFMFAYYGVVASGTGLSGVNTATGIVQYTGQQISTGLGYLDPRYKEPLVQTAIGLDFPLASLGGKIWRILQYLVELCLIVGFLRLVFRPATLGKLKAEYIALIIVSALILLGIFVLPPGSYGMGVTRIWQITLMLVSPLFIFGGETIALGIANLFGAFRRARNSPGTRLNTQAFIWLPVIVILIPYFIFNSGAVFEISRSQTTDFIDMPYSIALSGHRLDLNTIFTQQDLAAASWLCKVPKVDSPIYVDFNSSRLFVNQFDFPCKIVGIGEEGKAVPSTGYVYLRAWNAENKEFTFGTGYATRKSYSFDALIFFRPILEKADTIYNNGGAQTLFYR
jgi:uncharacterized membrane protein